MGFYSESGCSNEVAQNFLATDKCIRTPANPTADHNLLFASMLVTCQQTDNNVDLSMTLYSSSSCGGQSKTFTQSWTPQCDAQKIFSCQSDISSATAVVQKWPAVGAYFGDNTCSSLDAITSSTDQACVASASSNDWSVSVQESDEGIAGNFYQNTTSCTGNPTPFQAETRTW